MQVLFSDPGYITEQTFTKHGLGPMYRELKDEPKQLIYALNRMHYERNNLFPASITSSNLMNLNSQQVLNENLNNGGGSNDGSADSDLEL